MIIQVRRGLLTPGEDNDTPLHYAALMGHVEVARALLVAGADTAAVNEVRGEEKRAWKGER
jgi:ankyrin repeat protein